MTGATAFKLCTINQLISLNNLSLATFPRDISRYKRRLSIVNFPPWMLKLVKCYKVSKIEFFTCCNLLRVSEWQHLSDGQTYCPKNNSTQQISYSVMITHHFTDTVVVADRAESTESKFKQINFQWSEWCDQNIQSHVELLSSHQKRIINVARDNIRLLHQIRIEDSFAFSWPFLQLGKFVDQKNAGSLRFTTGFHNPGWVRILAIFFYKHVVVCWEDEGCWNEIQVQIPAFGTLLRQWITISL